MRSPLLAAVLAVASLLVACGGGAARQRSASGTPERTCEMDTEGRVACGYDCLIGQDGVVACAETPDGECAPGPDGRAYCTTASGRAQASNAPREECRIDADGKQVCGYNCEWANGRHYCSSIPEVKCTRRARDWDCP
jgi:hypothetical protein